MALFTLTCEGCGVEFDAGSSRAKWCSAACKKRRQRKPGEVPAPRESSGETRLVASVRAELEKADALDTFSGQLAIQLARKVSAADATGVASLSKELRLVMAEALGEQAGGEPESSDPDDELRKKRDAKREAARQASR